ncbi:MAG: DUF1893 domain-containing protein [Rikenellaceae bacterium]
MEALVGLLDEGGYSCVIAQGDSVRCFSQRGVADLYALLRDEPQLLRGARVADKVVGLGAAALMLRGGVAVLYTHVISQGALTLLEDGGVEVGYGALVPHIINRAGTGRCPLESRLDGACTLEEMLVRIDKFINEISNAK